MHGNWEGFEACERCFSDPDPGARFWAVFALGGLAQYRRMWHPAAIRALQPMVNDTGECPGYWSVGQEAQAMLEDMLPAQREAGERERAAILANPEAPSLEELD